MKQLIVLITFCLMMQGCAAVVVAGAAGAVATAHDRRSLGAQVEDNEIEFKLASALSKQKALYQATNVNIISYNRQVLLVGQAPSSQLKHQVEDLAYNIRGIEDVHNEIKVKKEVGLDTKSHDVWLTSKVKANLLTAKALDGTHIKVITEDSEVYLMGLVTEKEAKAAIKVTRHLNGVKRVVDVFERL